MGIYVYNGCSTLKEGTITKVNYESGIVQSIRVIWDSDQKQITCPQCKGKGTVRKYKNDYTPGTQVRINGEWVYKKVLTEPRCKQPGCRKVGGVYMCPNLGTFYTPSDICKFREVNTKLPLTTNLSDA